MVTKVKTLVMYQKLYLILPGMRLALEAALEQIQSSRCLIPLEFGLDINFKFNLSFSTFVMYENEIIYSSIVIDGNF